MPRISEETIERVAAANDIVEVISSYFPLKRAGNSWRALCPFHREKSPSFHVSPQKQAYYCFGCGAGGSVFKFVMEYERVDFVSAVRRLAQKAGVTVIEDAVHPGEEQRRHLRDRLLDLHRLAAAWFQHNLLRSSLGEGARTYLKSRAISADIARTWQLGYAPPQREALFNHARQAGFNAEELRASGLFYGDEGQPLSDRFRQRLMFPICNDYGEVIAFSGRILPPSDDPAKYVNSPETLIFSKGRTLFGLHHARRALADAGQAIVCEGQLDLIRIAESGLRHVVAPQGTAFTSAQARLLKRYADTALLCFDSDRAGRTAIERSLPTLLAAGFGVRVVILPPDEDPDSLIREQGVDKFRVLIDSAPNYFDFALDEALASGKFDDAAMKAVFVRKLAAFAASLSDDVARESLASRLAPRLAISPQAFLSSIPKKQALVEEADDVDAEESSRPQILEPDPALRLLLHAAFTDKETRQWLASQDMSFLADREGFFMLQNCLQATFDPADAAGCHAFMAAQSLDAQSVFAALLLARPPSAPLSIAQQSLQTLRIRQLQIQREAVTAKIRQTGLSPAEITRLQAEVVDITKKIQDTTGSSLDSAPSVSV